MNCQDRGRRTRALRNSTRLPLESLEDPQLLAAITEFGLTSGSNPVDITSGPDGALWFSEKATDKIGRISTGGTVTQFALAAGSQPTGITTGVDGNFWFTESGTGKVASIIPSGLFAGHVSEYSLAGGSQPYGITSGPVGRLWYTEKGTDKVGNIIPLILNLGLIIEFSLAAGSQPQGITTGSDGKLWFTEPGTNKIGQVSILGSVAQFAIPTPNSSPSSIVSGPGGDLYFAENSTSNIGRINTSDASASEFSTTTGSGPDGITVGPDNLLWFTESLSSKVGKLNVGPTSVGDLYAVNLNTVLTANVGAGVLANDSDPSGATLAALLVAGPAHGNLTLNADGSFVYTPSTGYIGPDLFTYLANDGSTNGLTTTVNLTVGGSVSAPVAVDDTFTTPGDTPLTVSAPGLLGNDIVAGGLPLVSVLVGGPSHGRLGLNADGSFTYTPDALFSGTDSFKYLASDGLLSSPLATVHLNVTPVNHAPVAANDVYSIVGGSTLTRTAAQGVLANDTDVDGDSLSAALVAGPTHGTLTLTANGSFTYTPNAMYSGPDSFSYRANDGTANSNTATVSLTVSAVNHEPVAVNDTASVRTGGTFIVTAPGLLGNDSDPDGNPLTAVLVTSTAHGSLVLQGDGSYVYTPSANYAGPDSFTYRASDGSLTSNVATVSLSVNRPPSVPGDYFGVGRTTFAVYLPSIGSFAFRNPDGSPDRIFQFGIAGHGQSIPVSVVDAALAEQGSTVSAYSIAIPNTTSNSDPIVTSKARRRPPVT